MKKILLVAALLCSLLRPLGADVLMFGPEYWAIVGDPGNAAHTASHGYGSVAEVYAIGKMEVTNAQYVDFLNAVAASDPYGLYDTAMGAQTRGGITRSGTEGNYSYAVKTTTWDYTLRPVNFVSVYDAMRYVNWLHNGATAGADTESGAYLLLGASATPSNAAMIVRSEGARYFLPSVDEWFKAAYYKGGGVDAGYWLYATSSDTLPVASLPGSLPNAANYNNAAGNPDVMPVGSYLQSVGPYGTFDQNGNLYEWTEFHNAGQSNYGQLGGSWGSSSAALPSTRAATFDPGSTASGSVGFRVAAAVPEPSVWISLGIGWLAMVLWRRQCANAGRAG